MTTIEHEGVQAPSFEVRTAEHNFSMATVETLAAEFLLPKEEVLYLALDAFGVQNGKEERIKVPFTFADGFVSPQQNPDGELHTIFKVVPGQNAESPLYIQDESIWLDGQRIANLCLHQADPAMAGYGRNFDAQGNPRGLTFNPNSRSDCTGCAMCPTALEASADPRALTKDEMRDSLRHISQGWEKGLSTIEDVTVSTGCFASEEIAVQTMVNLREVLQEIDLPDVHINLLTSQIRSDEAMQRLASEAGPFTLICTIEHQRDRHLLLKHSKADLTADDFVDIAKRARANGLGFGYNYIIGIDSLGEVAELCEKLLPYTTRFPSGIQSYQEHTDLMRQFSYCKQPEEKLRHLLQARKIFEALYADQNQLPEPWRNHRSLFPFTFNGQLLPKAEGMAKPKPRPQVLPELGALSITAIFTKNGEVTPNKTCETPKRITRKERAFVTHVQPNADGGAYVFLDEYSSQDLQNLNTHRPVTVYHNDQPAIENIRLSVTNEATFLVFPSTESAQQFLQQPIAVELQVDRIQAHHNLAERLQKARLLTAFELQTDADKLHMLGVLRDTRRHWQNASDDEIIAELTERGVTIDHLDLTSKERRRLLRDNLWEERFTKLIAPALAAQQKAPNLL